MRIRANGILPSSRGRRHASTRPTRRARSGVVFWPAKEASPMPQVKVPADGAKVTIGDGKLQVPDRPIVPFIEGDGTGPDIWRASVRVFDAAVSKAYGGR